MKISNDGELVTFNSREPWFTKEKSGRKPNTVRSFKATEDGRLEAERLMSSLFTLNAIEIVDAATNQRFRRLLTDVSVYDNRVVFSWQHQED